MTSVSLDVIYNQLSYSLETNTFFLIDYGKKFYAFDAFLSNVI